MGRHPEKKGGKKGKNRALAKKRERKKKELRRLSYQRKRKGKKNFATSNDFCHGKGGEGKKKKDAAEILEMPAKGKKEGKKKKRLCALTSQKGGEKTHGNKAECRGKGKKKKREKKKGTKAARTVCQFAKGVGRGNGKRSAPFSYHTGEKNAPLS